jgi:hypothetical protein
MYDGVLATLDSNKHDNPISFQSFPRHQQTRDTERDLPRTRLPCLIAHGPRISSRMVLPRPRSRMLAGIAGSGRPSGAWGKLLCSAVSPASLHSNGCLQFNVLRGASSPPRPIPNVHTHTPHRDRASISPSSHRALTAGYCQTDGGELPLCMIREDYDQIGWARVNCPSTRTPRGQGWRTHCGKAHGHKW